MRDRVHFLLIAGLLALAAGFAIPVSAERLGPGKYCGIVVFDRWDCCILHRGISVTYVSEKIKEQLRPYAGQAVQLDALEVHQPMNPGEALISKFKYLGPAPRRDKWLEVEGLQLRSDLASADGEPPVLDIYLKNRGDKSRTVFSEAFGPTLLKGTGRIRAFEPFDGPSFALISRQNFVTSGSDEPRTDLRGVHYGHSWAYKTDALPARFELKPGEDRRVQVRFSVAAGEYQFLAGYGGGVYEGQVLASNLVSFDVDKEGRTRLAKTRQK